MKKCRVEKRESTSRSERITEVDRRSHNVYTCKCRMPPEQNTPRRNNLRIIYLSVDGHIDVRIKKMCIKSKHIVSDVICMP